MTRCSYCGKNIDGVPFKCHRCTGHYCSKHHLPEDHNCPGLEKEKSKNQEKWKKAFVDTFSGKKISKSHHKRREEKSSLRKRSPLTKLKYFFIYKAKDFGDWLNDREHRKYNFGRRFNYLLGIIIPLAISIVAYAIFYANAQKLNDVNLWIIRLGGVLILVSVFFIIKYGIRFIKELINILKRQRNWLKYLIIILLIFLLWQAYTNKETVLNPVFDVYNQTNFSLFMPVNLGNFSTESDETTFPNWKNSLKDYSSYGTNPKTVKLSGIGDFVVYGGVNNYLAGKDRSISYYYVAPTTKDFVLRDLNDDVQKIYLDSLVDKIRNKSDDSKEQARIAIRMVQVIPYDWSAFESDNVDGRYPYEVLYDMEGVCMEKADLMAYLLRGLGFGVAIFEYNFENHRAVGIKCSNGNYGSNYCFIEATDYYPIGQIPHDYVGGADIRGATPEIIIISEGKSY